MQNYEALRVVAVSSEKQKERVMEEKKQLCLAKKYKNKS